MEVGPPQQTRKGGMMTKEQGASHGVLSSGWELLRGNSRLWRILLKAGQDGKTSWEGLAGNEDLDMEVWVLSKLT
jgi:hypothetical protein